MGKNIVNVTLHAGEAYGPASTAQALHDCGVHRLGHACRLREDGELDFSYLEIKKTLISGFKSSFLPFHEKKQMLHQIGVEMREIERDAAGEFQRVFGELALVRSAQIAAQVDSAIAVALSTAVI